MRNFKGHMNFNILTIFLINTYKIAISCLSKCYLVLYTSLCYQLKCYKYFALSLNKIALKKYKNCSFSLLLIRQYNLLPGKAFPIIYPMRDSYNFTFRMRLTLFHTIKPHCWRYSSFSSSSRDSNCEIIN